MHIILSKRITVLCTAVMVLSGCSAYDLRSKIKNLRTPNKGEIVETVATTDEGKFKPRKVKPSNLGRITVADASRVSNSELNAAVAKPTATFSRSLGKTVVSLGLLGETGFWLQTPLVNTETNGRVVYAGTGKSTNVRLIPNGAPSGSGSQMSIAAMQLLGIAITDLVEVQVFTR